MYTRIFLILNITLKLTNVLGIGNKCIAHNEHKKYKDFAKDLVSEILPSLEEINTGNSGKIGVIGGSMEYTGPPYFSAMTALRVGADLVYILTTEDAAPVIRSYSSDIVVFGYLNPFYIYKITSFITKMDILVIGPGLGRDNITVNLILGIIDICKNLRKPLVINANGLYALTKNISIIKNYPSPGVILTANHNEATRIIKILSTASKQSINWYNYWGENVSILIESKDDHFISNFKSCSWLSVQSETGKRISGQGDIKSGYLATLFYWTIKLNFCDKSHKTQIVHSISAYGAARLTRVCNYYAYLKYGRNMITSDMLKEIHSSFNHVFIK